jgi:hypothetical protein
MQYFYTSVIFNFSEFLAGRAALGSEWKEDFGNWPQITYATNIQQLTHPRLLLDGMAAALAGSSFPHKAASMSVGSSLLNS